MRKNCEIKGGGQEMAVMAYFVAKIIITAIQVNFVLIFGEAGMRQHKLY